MFKRKSLLTKLCVISCTQNEHYSKIAVCDFRKEVIHFGLANAGRNWQLLDVYGGLGLSLNAHNQHNEYTMMVDDFLNSDRPSVVMNYKNGYWWEVWEKVNKC